MATLSYVNIFALDIDRLTEFYASLLKLDEIVASRTEYYRGLSAGAASIGFSTFDVYELLGLQKPRDAGEHSFVTFDVGSVDEVRALTKQAVSAGATVVKEPFETYYGWFQSVLRDPEGNPFRLNFPGKPSS